MYYLIYRSFDYRTSYGKISNDCIGWTPYKVKLDISRRLNVLKVVEAPGSLGLLRTDDCFTEYFPETHHHDCGLIDYL